VLQRTETQWNLLVEKIFDLEDTLKNQISRDKRFKRTFQKQRTIFRRFLYVPIVGTVSKRSTLTRFEHLFF
jgi:hypothetical protein